MGFAKHDPLAAMPCWRICNKLSQQIVCQLLWKYILHKLAGHLPPQFLKAYRHLLAAFAPVRALLLSSSGQGTVMPCRRLGQR